MAGTNPGPGGSVIAQNRVCDAKGGFRNSKKNSGKACVECACSASPSECTLYPFSSKCCQNKDLTPHHVIPKHCFYVESVKKDVSILPKRGNGCEEYNGDYAPCICATGRDKNVPGQHRDIHDDFDPKEDANLASGKKAGEKRIAGVWKYKQARDAGIQSVCKSLPQCCESKKSSKCFKAQLDDYHKNRCCIQDGDLLKANSQPYGEPPTLPTGATTTF